MKLTVHMFQSADGVVQGPGGVDEDRSGGFTRGGWVPPYADEVFGEVVDAWFERAGALLWGRTTFEMMRTFWPEVTDPEDRVATAINTLPKYVASSTLGDPGWAGTTVLSGDVVAAVRELKARPGRELQVHGSAALVHTLHAAGLVDTYRILTFPVVVGEGKRLFPENSPATGLRLLTSRTTTTGAVYAEYVPAPFVVGDVAVEDGKEVISTP